MMSKKVWRRLIWAVWVAGLVVTKEAYGWRAFGLYILGSATYAGYVLLFKETSNE